MRFPDVLVVIERNLKLPDGTREKPRDSPTQCEMKPFPLQCFETIPSSLSQLERRA